MADVPLQIRCFGQFEVFRDGVAVDHWRRESARVLLKYLVVQRRPVAREALCDLLWPGVPASVAGGHLRVVLHALRQALGTWSGRDYVRADNDRLSLDLAAPLWIDAEVFVEHVHTAETMVRQERPCDASGEYSQAETIYRDDYLIEDALEQWTLFRREELKDRYQLVLTWLADFCMDTGDFIGSIARCHKLLAQDNCREDAYQRLMYCHAALGQRSRAERWYEMCAIALRNGLGTEPGQRTRELSERVASGSSVWPASHRVRNYARPVMEGRQA